MAIADAQHTANVRELVWLTLGALKGVEHKVIPEKKGQAANRKKGRQGGRPLSRNAELYKARNTAGRLINKLKA